MPYDQTFSTNYGLLVGREFSAAAIARSPWSRFAGFTTDGGKPVSPANQPKSIDKILVQHRELVSNNADTIDVPKFRRLKNLPTSGTAQLEGFEEESKINNLAIPVDLWRHANTRQSSYMENQIFKGSPNDLIKASEPLLKRHYQDVTNYLGPSYALYNGFSKNIYDSNWHNNNSKVLTVGTVGTSHPHIYSANTGKVAYSGGNPGTTGYENTAATDIDAITSAHVLDTQVIDSLATQYDIGLIDPVELEGAEPFRVLLVHPFQLHTLRQDTKFQQAATYSNTFIQSLKKVNPILAGAGHYYNGFMIYEYHGIVFEVSTASSKPVWGPSSVTDLTNFYKQASATKFGALVLGAGAVYRAIGRDVFFEGRSADYKQYKGLSYNAIEGYSRGDFWNRDDGTTGEHIINESSAVLVTYAAAPAFS